MPPPAVSTDVLVAIPEALIKAARSVEEAWGAFNADRRRGDAAQEQALRESLRRAHARIAMFVLHTTPTARIDA